MMLDDFALQHSDFPLCYVKRPEGNRKKNGKIPRENGMYYYEWLGLRENGLFSKNNGKLGNLLSETWTYCYCILIFVNGLAEGGIEQNRIGLSQ